VDHSVATQNDVKLDAALPFVTAAAIRIQTAYDDLVDDDQAEEEAESFKMQLKMNEDENREERNIDKEIVISELLKLVNLATRTR
jgi:condensin complex subunit 3